MPFADQNDMNFVIPAKAGIQTARAADLAPGFRRDDVG